MQPDSRVQVLINGHSGEPFGRVAVQRVQESNNVPVYLVLATFYFSACLRAAFQEWHSFLVLFRRLYSGDLGKQVLVRSYKPLQDVGISDRDQRKA